MHKQFREYRTYPRRVILALFIVSTLVTPLLSMVHSAKAASFSMQSGYYIGTGVAGKVISGLGFQPQYVMIKASNATTPAVFKTSAMPASNTAFMSAAADNTATSISFTSDGFILGTLGNVNTANILFTWTAYTGSDCSAAGEFCVGTYIGDGAASRTISTGFQPGVVIAKQTTAAASHFRTASMPAGQTDFFTSIVNNTAGAYLNAFTSTGFTTGGTDNTNAGVFNYIAFKTGTTTAAEGSYVGNGVDNFNITGVGFQPNFLLIKNDTSTTTNNRRSVMSNDQQFGDAASFPADTLTDLPNYIQALQPDGFQIGTGAGTNEASTTMYWFALGGVPPITGASGTYTMATGTYTGTGAALPISSVGFAPDLVIVKDNAANYMLFRTSMMTGNLTAYLFSPTADFTAGIVSLDANGFTIGASSLVNTSGNTYHWQAFGNAYRPDTKRGAADFAIGVYDSTGSDNMQMNVTPFQMDLVTVKRAGGSAAAFKTSAQVGDVSGSFSSIAEASNTIQALTSNGFQVGTNAQTSTLGNLYRWFGFKAGDNFSVGTYTGNGVVDRPITLGSGFTPNLAWIKQTTAVAGVSRPGTLTGDTTQYFANAANTTNRIKSFTTTGITVGTATEVNTNAGVYRYMAWKIPSSGTLSGDIVDAAGTSVANPVFAMSAIDYPFECSQSTGTLGTTNQKIRISNLTNSAAWSTSIAATDGSSAVWRNGGNTQQYDYNDTGGNPGGCSDGGDPDAAAGSLSVEPSAATLTPQSGCSSTGLTLGSNQTFSQSSVDSITLLNASTGANLNCYWDLKDIHLHQYIPQGQASDNYTLNLTITAVAS